MQSSAKARTSHLTDMAPVYAKVLPARRARQRLVSSKGPNLSVATGGLELIHIS